MTSSEEKTELKDDYLVRVATLAEVKLAVNWAAAEGWNPGHFDASLFHQTDPTGFYVGVLNGEPIASISVVKYGESYAFLGLYIVLKEHRGKGYGLRLWNTAIKSLGNRAVGLDGVVAQQGNYTKSGFTYGYRQARYEGKSQKIVSSNIGNVVPLVDLPFQQLQAYDALMFGCDRSIFLEAWVNQSNSFSFGVLDEAKQVCGYGLIRPCKTGFKIGPLFADSSDIAEALFSALSNGVPEGSLIYLDTPDINEAAVQLAQKYNMQLSFETARMYKGVAPSLPVDRIFGVTTFELG